MATNNPELLQRFLTTEDYQKGSLDARKLWVERFQALPEAEQQALVSSLTPARDPLKSFRPPGVPSIEEETLQGDIVTGRERALAAASISTAAQLGGASLGAATGPFAPVAIPAFEAGASFGARKLNVALGLEEPGLVGDIASVALPPVARGVAKAVPLAARFSRAGQAVTEAEELTIAQTAAHTERARTAEQTAAAANTRAQQVYEARVQHGEQTAAARTAAQEAKYERSVREAHRAAEEQTTAQSQAYQQQQQGYQQSVQQHREALTDLQAMPEQFRPETPSRTLYAAAAKANPTVALKNTAATAEELMGTPEGLQTISRGGVQPLAEELHDLARQSLTPDGLSYGRLQKIREDLGVEVSRLRRQGGAEYRDVARLYGALERDLAESPAQVLQAASRARRQEYAVEELAQMVQTGAPGIKRLSSGAYQVDPGQLMTRAEKALNDTEKLFGGSFTPDERARILTQFERHQGLAPIPRRPGEPPLPVAPRDVPVPEPVMPRGIMRPVPVQPKDVGPAPARVDPTTLLEPPSAKRLMGELGAGGMWAMYSGNVPGGMKVAATAAAADYGEYIISKMLLSPKGRPLLDRMMAADGTISPANMAILMNAARAMGMIGGPQRER